MPVQKKKYHPSVEIDVRVRLALGNFIGKHLAKHIVFQKKLFPKLFVSGYGINCQVKAKALS